MNILFFFFILYEYREVDLSLSTRIDENNLYIESSSKVLAIEYIEIAFIERSLFTN